MNSLNKDGSPPLKSAFSRYVIPSLVFIVGSGLVLGNYLINSLALDRQAQAEFHAAVQDRAVLIEDSLKKQAEVLIDVKNRIEATTKISGNDFRVFAAAHLPLHQGLQALIWVPKVSSLARPYYEKNTRNGTPPDFTFLEISKERKLVPAKNRPEYFPIYHVEPATEIPQFYGLDLTSTLTLSKTLKKSRDTGRFLASAAFRYPEQEDGQSNILIFAPIYNGIANTATIVDRQESLRGFAIALINVNEVIDAALAKLEQLQVHYVISDITGGGVGDQLIHTHLPDHIHSEMHPKSAVSFHHTRTIEVAGRIWRIDGYALDNEFLPHQPIAQAKYLFIAGLLVALLLAFYVYSLQQAAGARSSAKQKQNANAREDSGPLRTLLDNTSDGVLTFAENGEILSANAAASEIFALDNQQLCSASFKTLLPSLIWRSTTRQYVEFDLPSDTPQGGHKIALEIILGSYEQETEKAYLALVRDITKSVDLENLQDDFLATINHELKTPLTVIHGYLPLITDESKIPSPANVALIAQDMERASFQLLSLINNLLDIAALDAGTLSLRIENLDAVQLVKKFIESMKPFLTHHRVKLELKTPDEQVLVRADDSRIRQVLKNLVENAVNAQDEGVITVSLEIDSSAENAVFSVTDQGTGIDPEAQKTIFDRFRQADGSSSRITEGSGLGLAISKHLIELHRGKISLRSTKGEGTIFSFAIPLFDRKASSDPGQGIRVQR